MGLKSVKSIFIYFLNANFRCGGAFAIILASSWRRQPFICLIIRRLLPLARFFFLNNLAHNLNNYCNFNFICLKKKQANWTEANWLRFVAAAGAPLQFASMLFSMGFLTNSTHYVSIIIDKCFLQGSKYSKFDSNNLRN